ncbi:MAG: hypothetical protein ACI837_002537 [Crocinitomicaceae bacterium]|jgi:hypothetical protein
MRITLLLSFFTFLLFSEQALSQFSIQKVVLEQATGAWNGFSADGTVYADDIETQYPNAIVVSVHNADSMEIPDGVTVLSEWVSFYPTGLILRDGLEYNRS